jgi:hypothetical protein
MHQHAFEEIKRQVSQFCDHHHQPIHYGPDAEPIHLITDACSTGIASVISQGHDWKTSHVAVFFSAKLNAAQQNYPTHELEMFAGVETMKRHSDILLGVKFTWYTDHKPLVHLLQQKNLSGRQAHWIESLSDFNFKVEYIEGIQNILSNALSRVYSNDAPGTVCSPSEYPQFDEDHPPELMVFDISMPVYISIEANAISTRSKTGARPAWVQKPKRTYNRRPTTLEEAPQGDVTSTPSPLENGVEGVRDIDNVLHPNDEKDGYEPETEGALLDIVQTHLPDPQFNLLDMIRRSYAKDTFLQKIIETPKDFRNFIVEDQLIYLKESERKILCIPEKVIVNGHTLREILISESHSLLAHLAASKTYHYLRDHVWWKTMNQDVQKYCESCVTCKRSKPSNQKPYGLLNPLDVPSYPWESIGIDFLGPLPESSDRDGSYNSITVVIDLLTAMVHLIPSRTDYTAPEIAELIFAEVYKHHGLPKNIISD